LAVKGFVLGDGGFASKPTLSRLSSYYSEGKKQNDAKIKLLGNRSKRTAKEGTTHTTGQTRKRLGPCQRVKGLGAGGFKGRGDNPEEEARLP